MLNAPLYDDSFRESKLIPLHLINITCVTLAFKLHPSLSFSFQPGQFLKFYQNIFRFLNTASALFLQFHL